MAYEFTTRRTVEFSDTDMAGIVHFASYFRYMEAVEHAFFRSLGLSIHMEIDGRTFTFPRVHAECAYHSPLRFEDIVELHLLVREVRAKAMVFDVVFTAPGEGRARHVARGSITTVCVTREAGGLKSAPIPPRVLDRIQAAPAEVLDRYEAALPNRP